MPTINVLSKSAGAIAQARSAAAGHNPRSPILFALASGMDVALTILEQSTGAMFSDLTPEATKALTKYFIDEAESSEAIDPQIAIFYRSWAEVLTTAYLSP